MLLVAASLIALPARSHALNKQGARNTGGEEATPIFDVSGYAFGGVFLYNPSYAARPNNTGNVLLRYGLHVDVDLYRRWLSLSYDLNVFTDRSDSAVSPLAPTEDDHIIGLLSTIPLPHHLELTMAVHFETDQPGFEAVGGSRTITPTCHAGQTTNCYLLGYSQSYVDAYARLQYSHPHITVSGALGGFLWNESYAARPDNSGLALLRYDLHADIPIWTRLVFRIDFNFFTDRQDAYVVPTELDITSELGVKLGRFEVKLVGEADLPLRSYPGGPNPATNPGIRQEYLALMLAWNFELSQLKK